MSSITTDRERLTAFASVIKELNHLSSARQVQLWQTALVASVGFLGILLSLPPVSTPLPLHTRLVFLSALVSLSLGCLSIAIVLYDHSRTGEEAIHRGVNIRTSRTPPPERCRRLLPPKDKSLFNRISSLFITRIIPAPCLFFPRADLAITLSLFRM